MYFFVSSRRRHTRWPRDWSSDVCSSDLTNLELGLANNHIWHGGSAIAKTGVEFNPNIPTEEVFSMPDKYGVNGTVSSTKPLNYGGSLIDNFKLTFKDGRSEERRVGKE